MEPPSENWPKAIFDSDALGILEDDFGSCQGDIVDWAELHYEPGLSPKETPEDAACLIGQMAYNLFQEDDYFLGIIDTIECEEGAKLAKGYIGLRAIKESDL